MALFIRESPFNFFDSFVGDYYRQMVRDMDIARGRMFQLMPPDFPVCSTCVPGETAELEPAVPVVEEDGQRKMKLQFNVKDYKPEEVSVKVLRGNELQVRAEHEEKNEQGSFMRRMYVRQYRLPKGVDVEQLKPTWSKDGVLSIEAPAPGLAQSERLVPIQYQPGDDHPAEAK